MNLVLFGSTVLHERAPQGVHLTLARRRDVYPHRVVNITATVWDVSKSRVALPASGTPKYLLRSG
jgi:hypothetical protein